MKKTDIMIDVANIE